MSELHHQHVRHLAVLVPLGHGPRLVPGVLPVDHRLELGLVGLAGLDDLLHQLLPPVAVVDGVRFGGRPDQHRVQVAVVAHDGGGQVLDERAVALLAGGEALRHAGPGR